MTRDELLANLRRLHAWEAWKEGDPWPTRLTVADRAATLGEAIRVFGAPTLPFDRDDVRTLRSMAESEDVEYGGRWSAEYLREFATRLEAALAAVACDPPATNEDKEQRDYTLVTSNARIVDKP